MKPEIERLLEIVSTYELKDSYYRNVHMSHVRLDMFVKYIKPYIEEINAECDKVGAYPKFLDCHNYFYKNKERICILTNYPKTVLYYFDNNHLFNNVTKFHEDLAMIKQQAIEKATLIGQVKIANDKIVEELMKAIYKEDYIGTAKHLRPSFTMHDYDQTRLKQKYRFRYKTYDLGYIELPMLEELTVEKKDKLIRLTLHKFRKAFMQEMTWKLNQVNNVNLCSKPEMIAYARHLIKTKDVGSVKKIYKYKYFPEDIKHTIEGMAIACRLMK